jgi:hypothetical protein
MSSCVQINEKKTFFKLLFYLLLPSFFLIYFIPEFWMTEFRWKEGLYTAIASEMGTGWPNTMAHGEMIGSVYPFFPFIVSLFLKAGVPVSMAARTVSVVFVFATAVTIWIVAYRAYDIHTAAIASSIFFSSMVVMEKGIEGYPEVLSFFLLFCGWLSWFAFGMQGGRWNMAWLFAFFFCGLAFYSIGWAALFFFFFPFIFMRRPLSIWSRINKPGFYVGLIFPFFFAVVLGLPRWIAGQDMPFRDIAGDISGGYFKQLLLFPFAFAWRIFPWTFIVWPAFCAAYDPLERNPIFAKFLKTIFFTLFFMMWLVPGNDPREYILLIIPLALLAGSRYAILVRRHSEQINGILKYLSSMLMIIAILTVVFYILPGDFVKKVFILEKGISFHSSHRIFGIAQGILGTAILFVVLQKLSRKQISPFIHILCLSTAMMMLFWSVVVPYRAQIFRQRDLAKELKIYLGNDFSNDLIVYQSPELEGRFFGTFLYLGCKTKRLQNNLDGLPKESAFVYLMGSDVPIYPSRDWTKKMEIKNPNIYLWKGELSDRGQKNKNE